ncbi:MAG: Lpg1974 family pore-forming outer membrane protein [Pirellulales bacterium]|nr:Lpg1974 family pore-forming outer membrane protein [Pirellulales bacterium]
MITDYSPIIGSKASWGGNGVPLAQQITRFRHTLDIFERSERTGWFAAADFLNWTLRRQDLDFAITEDGSSLTIGQGQVHNLMLGTEPGARFETGYRSGNDGSISFRYTFVDFSDTASATRPGGGGRLFATRSHPEDDEEADQADAVGTFHYDVLDLEVAQRLHFNETAVLKLLGGFRWVDIDQNNQYRYDGRDFDNGLIQNQVDMNGFGVYFGSELRWSVPHNFQVFMRGEGAILYGDFESHLFQSDSSGADVIVDVTNNYWQSVPSLAAVIGISWELGCVQLSSGYELTSWFNLSDRSSFNDSNHSGAFTPNSGDILLDGLVVRVQCLW